MKLILGGSMSRVGALSECPFQGDESIHSAGLCPLLSRESAKRLEHHPCMLCAVACGGAR